MRQQQSAVIEKAQTKVDIQSVLSLTATLGAANLSIASKRSVIVGQKEFARVATAVDSKAEGLLLHSRTLTNHYPELAAQIERLSGELSPYILLLECVEMASASIAVILLSGTVDKADRPRVVKKGMMMARKLTSLSLEAFVRLEAWEWHPTPSFTTNLEGRLLSFNKALRSLLGATKAYSVQHLFGPQFIEILQNRWLDLQKAKHLQISVQLSSQGNKAQVVTVNAAVVGDTVIASTQLSLRPKAAIPLSRVQNIKKNKGLFWLLARNQNPILLGPKTEMTIGRDPSCDLPLPTDNHASRTHARLVVLGNSIKLEDLGSNNGTYINGRRVSRHVLCDGDRIRVGRTEFCVKATDAHSKKAKPESQTLKAEASRTESAAKKKKEVKVITKGDIAQKALVHVFQGISSYARTGTIRVVWDDHCGEISFIDGIPYSASFGRLKDLNAAIFMLNLKEGNYVLTDQKPQSRRTMFCDMMKLYMTRIPMADLRKML